MSCTFCEIDAENVFPFMQTGCFQNLLALQGAVGLHGDLAQLVIGVFEEQPFRGVLHSEVAAGHERENEHYLRKEHEDAAVAVLRGFARTHFHIEQMLLLALSRIGNALIARRGSSWARFHFAWSRRAREFDDARAQVPGN